MWASKILHEDSPVLAFQKKKCVCRCLRAKQRNFLDPEQISWRLWKLFWYKCKAVRHRWSAAIPRLPVFVHLTLPPLQRQGLAVSAQSDASIHVSTTGPRRPALCQNWVQLHTGYIQYIQLQRLQPQHTTTMLINHNIYIPYKENPSSGTSL